MGEYQLHMSKNDRWQAETEPLPTNVEEMWNEKYYTPSRAWGQMLRVADAELDRLSDQGETHAEGRDYEQWADLCALRQDIVKANWITQAETWLIGRYYSFSIIECELPTA